MTEGLNHSRSTHTEDLRRPSTEVIICTYNGARFIQEQLQSIFAQKQKPDLISIYDDQSSDDTVNIVRQMISQGSAVDVPMCITINPINLGYSGNFSNAIAQARKDVLFLCDQDDRWRSDKIQASICALKDSGTSMIFSDGLLIDAQGQLLSTQTVLTNYGLSKNDIINFTREPVSQLVRRNYVNGAAMAVLRKVAQAALPVPSGMPHDYWLAIWCSLHGGVVAVPETLYEYRQHSGNLIGVGIHRWRYQWVGIWQNPRPPRLREVNILTQFLPRILDVPDAMVFKEKLEWLQACVIKEGRFARLIAIMSSTLRGQYRRFGAPYALVRDLVSVLRKAT